MEKLRENELIEISGGGFWIGVLGALVVHIGIEAYNDWNSHADAFIEGSQSVQ